MKNKLDKIRQLLLDLLSEYQAADKPMHQDLLKLHIDATEANIQQYIQRCRTESFMLTKIACSFNKDCKNCGANKLTLDYLAQPTTAVNKMGDI